MISAMPIVYHTMVRFGVSSLIFELFRLSYTPHTQKGMVYVVYLYAWETAMCDYVRWSTISHESGESLNETYNTQDDVQRVVKQRRETV